VPGGTIVTLSDATAQKPTFTAPVVAPGGETLTFELTVTANGESSVDTVSVTIVNVNHTPVADAGADRTVAEGSPVILDGGNSFDIDNDLFSYEWGQVDNGSPAVTLLGADTASPAFTAPLVGGNGAPGVVATLVFELRVDDGYPEDEAAPGFTSDNVVDRVTVEITNVNNQPTAKAGTDQTVNENSSVALDATTSSDPDSDTLLFSWMQTSGPSVALAGATSATPTFTAPWVNAGGANLEFEITVEDGYGGSATDRMVVHVQNINDPPLASAAHSTTALLWPPNHQMIAVGILGVSDPNDDRLTIEITSVTQDEPTKGLGDGDTPIDAVINGDGTVLLRSERSGKGDGRVYRIYFTASDREGSSSGVVVVRVPQNAKSTAVDSSMVYDSTH